MFKDSIAKFFKIDTLLSNLTGYVESRIELLKLEVKEEIAKNLSKAILYFLIVLLFAFFITFLSVAVALVIGVSYGMVAGFGIVGAFYFAAALVLFLFRKKIGEAVERKLTLMFSKK